MSNSAHVKPSGFKRLLQGPLFIAGLYLLAGLLWITCSDLVLDRLISDPQLHTMISIVKGYVYVGATALALFFAMRYLQTQTQHFSEELAESEHAYRSLFENNPNPMWVIDIQSLRFLAVNRAATRVYGYTRSEFDQLTLHSLLDVDAGLDVGHLLAGTTADAGLRHGVSRHRTRDGEVRYVETASYSTQFEGVAACMLIAHDISRRIDIENNLRESKSRLRFAQQLVGFGTLVVDIESGELGWSDEALRIFGFDPSQPKPDLTQLFAVLEEADRSVIRRRLQQQVAGKQVPSKAELRVRGAGGEYRYLSVYMGERQWQRDGRMRLVVVLMDITERKRIEQQRKRSERHYRQLVELLPEALLVLVGREIRFANPAAKKLFADGGNSGVGLVGLDLGQLIADDTDLDAVFQQPAELIQHAEFRPHCYRRLNGETFMAECAVIARSGSARDDERSPTVTLQVVIRDLTNQRRMQEALTTAHTRLQRMSSQLIRTDEAVRHQLGRELHDDVGQLLTFINMTATALEINLAGGEQENRAVALRAAAGEALAKVRDLTLMLRPPQLDVEGLETALQIHLERFLRESGVSFSLRCLGLGFAELGQRPDPEVEIALFRVVQEAVTNVVRHANATHIDIRISGAADSVELDLVDDGCGFDVERALSSTTTAGLLGMRERTLLLGGEFHIQSALGVGTELSVWLPRVISS